MKIKLTLVLLLFLSLLSITVSAQVDINDTANPCITAEQYAILEKHCNENASSFIRTSTQRPAAVVLLNWPLQAAASFTDCSYYFISAHVDQNTAASAFKDYNCGTITYDGHKGTDIATSPFGFFKMEHDQVEVIAAAAGTIIDKHDGEYDRNCVSAGSSLPANYVILQHADGSRTLYWHMKKGKVTLKAIGQTVIAGEYLGIVGSSGSASGPHLHFEVWAGSTSATYTDPFSGSCNLLSAGTRWVSEKPYTEPAIIKAGIFTTDYTPPAVCGTTETVNESTVFVIPFQGNGLSAGYAKFYIFVRNPTAGTTANMSILNPDGSTFATTPPWTQSFASTGNFGTYQASKKLPTIPGIYTFQTVYNGITCSQHFEIRTCAENYSAWSGTTSTDWGTASNWSCGTVPDINTNVIIYAGVPNQPVINSIADCRSIKIFSSANVKVNTGFKLNVYH